MTSGTVVRVEPLTSTIGAVVHDVDLTGPVELATIEAVRAALLRWRVLFLRDQHVAPSQQVAFARWFGELTPAHPLQGGLDERQWHRILKQLPRQGLIGRTGAQRRLWKVGVGREDGGREDRLGVHFVLLRAAVSRSLSRTR